MAPRKLRPSASASSLPRVLPSLSSTTSQTLDGCSEPTLAELIQLEQQQLAADEDPVVPPTAPRQRRRSSASLWTPLLENERAGAASRPTLRSAESAPFPAAVSPSALLLPPHYGRPTRPSSPDALAALLRPILASLSRPSSPAMSPDAPGTPAPSSPARRLHTSADYDSVPLDRSASSLPAQFPPREPTDPAPTVESQGFVLYIGSLVAYVAYLVWAFLPGDWLEAIGIEWYPARDWALLVPAWFVMLMAFTYASYFCLNLYNTPPLDSPELLDDPRAFVPPPPRPPPPIDGSLHQPTPLWAHAVLLPEDAIPPLYDLPIEVVNRVLYGD